MSSVGRAKNGVPVGRGLQPDTQAPADRDGAERQVVVVEGIDLVEREVAAPAACRKFSPGDAGSTGRCCG